MQAIGRQAQRAPDGAPVHYERHRPEQTALYRLVQQHAASCAARAANRATALEDLPVALSLAVDAPQRAGG